MKSSQTLFTGFLSALLLISCSDSPVSTDAKENKESKNLTLDSLNFSVEEAPEWTALFKRQRGWFGGDGIFSVNMNGKETPASSGDSTILFWFSDSMLGEIKDSLQPGSEMINNSAALLKSNTADTAAIGFFWRKQNGRNTALFIPNTPHTKKGDYYWLGDGFINQEKNNDLYIFSYRMQNTGAAVFGFKEVGNALIIVPRESKPPFTTYRQVEIPFFEGKESDTAGTWGCGVYVNTKEAGVANADGYLYVYGIKGKDKKVIVARVKPADIESFQKWTFWDGKSWNHDAATLAPVADHASNELGLMQLQDGRYALIFHEDGLGKHVELKLGKTPSGPFGKTIKIWNCDKDISMDKDFISYNSKVHPVLSKQNELIISYNINSLDFTNDLKQYPDFYRPRFIRLKVLSN